MVRETNRRTENVAETGKNDMNFVSYSAVY